MPLTPNPPSHGIIEDGGGNAHFSLRRIAATAERLGIIETDKLIESLIYQVTSGADPQ